MATAEVTIAAPEIGQDIDIRQSIISGIASMEGIPKVGTHSLITTEGELIQISMADVVHSMGRQVYGCEYSSNKGNIDSQGTVNEQMAEAVIHTLGHSQDWSEINREQYLNPETSPIAALVVLQHGTTPNDRHIHVGLMGEDVIENDVLEVLIGNLRTKEEARYMSESNMYLHVHQLIYNENGMNYATEVDWDKYYEWVKSRQRAGLPVTPITPSDLIGGMYTWEEYYSSELQKDSRNGWS